MTLKLAHRRNAAIVGGSVRPVRVVARVEQPVRRGEDVVRRDRRERAAVRAVVASRIRRGIRPARGPTATPDVALSGTRSARTVSSRTAEHEGEPRSQAR